METIKSFTSLEQSKKLVELGLDPSTADMHYYSFRRKDDVIVWTPEIGETSKYDIPCWSVGRLIELMPYRIFDNGVSKYLSIVKDESDTFCITYYDITIAAFEDIASTCFKAMVWLIENHYKK